MKKSCKIASIFILCILISVSITLAVPKDNGKAKGKGKEQLAQAVDKGNQERERERETQEIRKAKYREARIAVGIFAREDRDIIRRHFFKSQENLPPGLAKRNGDLPPGLEKQLQRNGHLPPGLEKRLNPFPVELERRLPPLREGFVRGVIGDRAIIMERKTSRILDAFGIR